MFIVQTDLLSAYKALYAEVERAAKTKKSTLVKVVLTCGNGDKVTRRFFINSSGQLGVLYQGARRYGRAFNSHHLEGYTAFHVPQPKAVDPEKKWRTSWEKALARLEASGLWTEVAEDIRKALAGEGISKMDDFLRRPAKIKKMYFGRFSKNYLDRIAKALQGKQECSFMTYAQYDVSYKYDPTLNKAWYSEEYRGCGNGHYYLALDATHAVFYEDD